MIWDALHGTARNIRQFHFITNLLGSLAFSVNGRMVLRSSGDGDICVWDTQTGKEVSLSAIDCLEFDCAWFSYNRLFVRCDGKYRGYTIYPSSWALHHHSSLSKDRQFIATCSRNYIRLYSRDLPPAEWGLPYYYHVTHKLSVFFFLRYYSRGKLMLLKRVCYQNY